MKKLLLTLAFACYGIAGFAQANCAGAVNITANGVYTVGTINGTYPGAICFTGTFTGPNALWYKFTPTTNGILTVSSDIDANPDGETGTDSRLSILTGACNALTCVAASDDVSVDPPVNYRSKVQDLPVTANTTYYIVWDDRWSNLGFSFELTFTPQTCIVPTAFTFLALPTETTASLGWTAPTAGTAPQGYQFEYGVQGFTQGTGTILNPTTNQVQLANLSPSTIYSFYVRTFCGGTDYSIWQGPISFATQFNATTIPYDMSFDTTTNLDFIGWSSTITGNAEDWFILEQAETSELNNDGTNSIVSIASTTGPTNQRIFSRGIQLGAGDQVEISYAYRNFVSAATATNTSSYVLTAGNAPTVAGQTIILNSQSDIANVTFEQASTIFSAPSAGVYYFSFLHDSPQNTGTATHALVLDTLTFRAPLSVNNPDGTKLAVFPNPTTDILNITNLTNGFASANVTDLNGRVVKSVAGTVANEAQISIADLAAGIYLLNVTSNEGSVSTVKVVKK
ncbi:T9SS type A sorting domain-containing protein [Flavobacterium sp.]|uniref:T9SS type A sorting domain-containing protein n=1 Tax=Flavobacterium sp. TaxID=239 RepID=UPI00261E6B08|nr:T9SS type A sorting domain-containing protein [Flavobacterium sp.]